MGSRIGGRFSLKTTRILAIRQGPIGDFDVDLLERLKELRRLNHIEVWRPGQGIANEPRALRKVGGAEGQRIALRIDHLKDSCEGLPFGNE